MGKYHILNYLTYKIFNNKNIYNPKAFRGLVSKQNGLILLKNSEDTHISKILCFITQIYLLTNIAIVILSENLTEQ